MSSTSSSRATFDEEADSAWFTTSRLVILAVFFDRDTEGSSILGDVALLLCFLEDGVDRSVSDRRVERPSDRVSCVTDFGVELLLKHDDERLCDRLVLVDERVGAATAAAVAAAATVSADWRRAISSTFLQCGTCNPRRRSSCWSILTVI